MYLPLIVKLDILFWLCRFIFCTSRAHSINVHILILLDSIFFVSRFRSYRVGEREAILFAFEIIIISIISRLPSLSFAFPGFMGNIIMCIDFQVCVSNWLTFQELNKYESERDRERMEKQWQLLLLSPFLFYMHGMCDSDNTTDIFSACCLNQAVLRRIFRNITTPFLPFIPYFFLLFLNFPRERRSISFSESTNPEIKFTYFCNFWDIRFSPCIMGNSRKEKEEVGVKGNRREFSRNRIQNFFSEACVFAIRRCREILKVIKWTDFSRLKLFRRCACLIRNNLKKIDSIRFRSIINIIDLIILIVRCAWFISLVRQQQSHNV